MISKSKRHGNKEGITAGQKTDTRGGMMVSTGLQPRLHVVIPPGTTFDQAAAAIAAILARNGYGVAEMLSRRNGCRREIDMEGVYKALDNGTKMEELLRKLGVTYQTLSRRHKEYQKSLSEDERRTDIVKFKETGRPPADIPMEWVYEQIDGGCSVREVANKLHVGIRTLYSRHADYQKNLKKCMEGSAAPYLRENLTRGPACPGRVRRKKEINMEEVYDQLLSGKGICEVATAFGVTSTALNNHHNEYQEKHKGKRGKYIRRTLKDFKG